MGLHAEIYVRVKEWWCEVRIGVKQIVFAGLVNGGNTIWELFVDDTTV